MRKNILSFNQGSYETFHEAWERLRGYTRDCPHHGFTREAILSYFYWGVSKEHKWTLDIASKGSFLNLTMEEGELLVENLAKSGKSYNESHDITFKEGSCEDSKWKTLQDKLDRVENLLSVQQRATYLASEKHQNEERRRVLHQILQGQQLNDIKFDKMLEAMNDKIEGLHDEITLKIAQLGDPKHKEEAKDVGITLPYGLDSAQWVHEEKSVFEEIEGDELALNGNCLSSFFFPSLEIKENMSNCENKSFAEQDEGVMVMKSDHNKLDKCVKGVLDGECLQRLFGQHMGSAQEKEVGRATRANLGTTRKIKKPQPLSIDSSPNKISLIPLRFKDGKIEYKVKGNGKFKPFSSAKAIITPSLQEDPIKLQELLSQVLTITLEGVHPFTTH